jgi:hypothetical protein
MQNAKIKAETLLKYPYTFSDLRDENPHTRYDNRFSLSEWYARTEDASVTGASVVEVVFANEPEHDKTTHRLIPKDNPELIDGIWVIGWEIIELLDNTDGIFAPNNT